MKSARFCEILKEIAWTAGVSPQEVPNAETLEHWAAKQIDCTEKPVFLFLQMTDETDKPLAGSFSLERLMDGVPISFRRHTANEMGFAAVWLCPGMWRVRASKGPEYTVQETLVEAAHPQTVVRMTLSRHRPAWLGGWELGDIHHHSVFSSRLFGGTDPVSETPQEVMHSMCAAGLSFGALSDHHNVRNHALWKQTEQEHFLPLISKEISTSAGHVIALNVPHDVVFAIPQPENRTDDYLRREFVRITQEIHAAGGLAQLNHPRDRQTAISWNPEWMDLIEIFDTMEVWNGAKPMIPGTSTADAMQMWLTLLEKGVYLPAATGSDTHNTRCDDYSAACRAIREQLCHGQETAEQWRRLMEIFEAWQRTALGSGGVFTMLRPTSKDAQGVQDALKKGRAVLSSGPLLLPVLSGALPGEDAPACGALTVHLQSNRPLSEIELRVKGNRKIRYPLKPYEKAENGWYCYDHVLQQAEMEQKGWCQRPQDWVVVSVWEGHACAALSNPIFISQHSDQ